ncbi:hypothetical protein UA08_02193 [Talaromyces atroroseus]|uniref:Uncharacterized protein n=1 Tax=Talaromyces atroroseus TaxID=1441469 RepID=A0A225ATH3_TALAT|nr:hypothetical protein UA08_02193 [Talaromyces atroroseus]OKL61664.1 hypothetical protein UA08_02193 [Talaromyces atroroseus]
MKERNYRADWGDVVSFVQRMREKAKRLQVDLLVVDPGLETKATCMTGPDSAINVYVNDTTTNDNELVPIGSRVWYFQTPYGIRIMAFDIIFDMDPPADDTEVHLAHTMIEEDWFKSAVQHEDIDLNDTQASRSRKYDETVRWFAMSGIKSNTCSGVMNPLGVLNPTRPAKSIQPQPGASENSQSLDATVRSDLRYRRQGPRVDTPDGLGVSKRIPEL